MAYGFSELLREQLLELYSEFFPRSVKRDGGEKQMLLQGHFFLGGNILRLLLSLCS